MALHLVKLAGTLALATGCVHFANMLSIRYLDDSNVFVSAAKLCLFAIPLMYISAVGFSVYYGSGAKQLPYVSLVLVAAGMSAITGIALTLLIQKISPSPMQMLGCLLLLAGIVLTVLGKQ